jgi:hypothetical protein
MQGGAEAAGCPLLHGISFLSENVRIGTGDASLSAKP